ncbi:SRPBCC family protein [Vibrio coralliilyticus]|uniref:SRPBCC family protein n=1 Tax=Vibrio coralliilyticus TaxID=190893 RepID=A0AAP6ZLH6_9VIBR|nr:SRPBCC family protein [Vibrio coralliilyticus]NOJ21510.1 SRPBCC family protein [Vibrio coralliilyticus]
MKITKKVTINKSAELVWDLIAHQFDKAHLWMDPIPHSYEIGTGHSSTGAPMEGRICNLSKNPNGAKAKEVITQYNEANKSLTFEITPINVPTIVPVKKNQVQMTVRSLGTNKSEVIWYAQPQLKFFAYPFYPLLRLAIPGAFGKLLNGLKTYSEQSLPNQQSSAAYTQ